MLQCPVERIVSDLHRSTRVVFGVIVIVASDAAIDQVLWIMNPEKLGAVASRAA